jgi:hypothetical protein
LLASVWIELTALEASEENIMGQLKGKPFLWVGWFWVKFD